MSLNRRDFIGGSLKGAVLGAVAAGGGWYFINRHKNSFELHGVRPLMKTSVSVTVIAESSEQGRRAINAAFTRMSQAASLLTRFDPGSPVFRLNREGRLDHPPAELVTVIDRAQHFSRISDGAFDVTVLPVLDYYFSLPTPVDIHHLNRAVIKQQDRRVDYRKLLITADSIQFSDPGMAITLDGIAKGYVVDQGISALRQYGITRALIDAGGDVHGISEPGSKPWLIGITDPIDIKRLCAVVSLRNGALTTSGNYEVFFSVDRRLFHIINPHTGMSPDHYSSVTTLTRSSMDADALGVTLFSLPLEKVRNLMAQQGHEWFIIGWDGEKAWRSKGFPLIRGAAEVV